MQDTVWLTTIYDLETHDQEPYLVFASRDAVLNHFHSLKCRLNDSDVIEHEFVKQDWLIYYSSPYPVHQ